MSTLYERVNWKAGETAISSGNLNQMDEGIRRAVPVGDISLWPLPDAPPGFLTLDGSTVLRANYPELWSFIDENELAGPGKLYGEGDGVDTFTLPDARDRFIRGTPAGSEAGETGGSKTHTHVNPTTSSAGGHSHGNPSTSSVSNHTHSNPSTGSAGGHSHSVGNTGAGGSHAHSVDADSHSHSFSDSFGTGTENQSGHTVSQGAAFGVADLNHTHSGSVSGTTSSDNHSHGMDSAGNHSHTNPGTSTQSSHQHSVGSTGSGGGHSHSVGDTDSVSGHSHGQGATEASNNLPPWLNLHLIVAT